MIRSILRRPLLPVASALVLLGVTGAGYAASTDTGSGAAPQAANAAGQVSLTQSELAARDYSVARDQGRRLSAQAEVHQRAADEQAHADYLVRLEEERAREAAETERLAAEEAARAAEAERLVEQEAVRLAEQEARAAEEARASEQASRSAVRDPRSAARVMLADFGWSSGQFDCLDSLWQKESGWVHTADNPTSSAYGIPQALPGSKMASAGSDWETNPVTQIRWGLGYIDDVYGSPCSAWAHSEANNWY